MSNKTYIIYENGRKIFLIRQRLWDAMMITSGANPYMWWTYELNNNGERIDYACGTITAKIALDHTREQTGLKLPNPW